METLRLSLVDSDYKVVASAGLSNEHSGSEALARFLVRMHEELAAGQSATLEIQDHAGSALSFQVTQAM